MEENIPVSRLHCFLFIINFVLETLISGRLMICFFCTQGFVFPLVGHLLLLSAPIVGLWGDWPAQHRSKYAEKRADKTPVHAFWYLLLFLIKYLVMKMTDSVNFQTFELVEKIISFETTEERILYNKAYKISFTFFFSGEEFNSNNCSYLQFESAHRNGSICCLQPRYFYSENINKVSTSQKWCKLQRFYFILPYHFYTSQYKKKPVISDFQNFLLFFILQRSAA